MSLGETVSGPDYTYHSGSHSTIVDYVLADVEASSCIESCEVLEDTNQNTSDYLALTMTISCDVYPPNLQKILIGNELTGLKQKK